MRSPEALSTHWPPISMPLDDSVEDGGLVSVAVDMRVLPGVTENGPEFGPHAARRQATGLEDSA